MSEIDKAVEDALLLGSGFMKDGKHVPLKDIYEKTFTASEVDALLEFTKTRLFMDMEFSPAESRNVDEIFSEASAKLTVKGESWE